MIYFWGSFIYKSDSVGVFASPAMNLATRRWLFYTSFFSFFSPSHTSWYDTVYKNENQ